MTKAKPVQTKEKLPWYEKLARWRRFALGGALRRAGDCICKAHCHCEDCPLSWEERGYEDCDAGCLLYEDLYEGSPGCYLPLFVKKLIKRHIERKRDHYEAKQWDGMVEWFQQEEKMQNAMRDAIHDYFYWTKVPEDAHIVLRQNYMENCMERGIALKAEPAPKLLDRPAKKKWKLRCPIVRE